MERRIMSTALCFTTVIALSEAHSLMDVSKLTKAHTHINNNTLMNH